ncbi:MAG TPA: XRE family transcriptional regulator [Burkholderiales bacterium]|nr:XRE family transcriptional regulator [Burkholderiales bacterium]
MTTDAKLGPALHALRRRLKLTLAEVSKKTGVSVSTLSKVERNQLSLTYDKLVRLSRGLDVDITVFFEHPDESPAVGQGRRSVNRVTDGQVIDTQNHHYVYLSTDLLRKSFVPIISDIRARSLEEFGQLVGHPGEEFTFVLEGRLAIHTEHYAPVVLEAGESMYFDSGMAHGYVALGNGRCRVLSICSAPEAALREAMERVPRIGAPAEKSAVARRKRTGMKRRAR